jgi:hypothetical protein
LIREASESEITLIFRQIPCRGEFVLAEVAAADPDQRDEINDFVVVEVVDQFAQLRLGRVVALVKTLLAVLTRVEFLSGIGFVRKVLEVERAGSDNDVLDLVEADVQLCRIVAFIDC